MGCCEKGNEIPGYIKCGGFFLLADEVLAFKKDPFVWSELFIQLLNLTEFIPLCSAFVFNKFIMFTAINKLLLFISYGSTVPSGLRPPM